MLKKQQLLENDIANHEVNYSIRGEIINLLFFFRAQLLN
jgi:hypothetical protein